MTQLKFNTKRIIFPVMALVFALGLVGLLQATLVAQAAPVAQTTDPTSTPTAASTTVITTTPTTPTPTATDVVTTTPTATPTDVMTTTPTVTPTSEVTTTPTVTPTDVITTTPTATPTDVVTSTPTVEPTVVVTSTPTVTPTTTPTTTLGFTVEVTGSTEVNVGDTFEVSVVADNIPDPGIFGYQFALNWDDTVLAPVSGTLNLNSDFSVVAKSLVSTGTLEIAVSRQGDVPDLTGPLTLLTVEMQANTVTDPETTALTLADWKFGRKGGFDVPVDTVINLDVVVVEDTGNDIVGTVKVEGRADDNQAGHTVTDEATMTATTNISGEFTLPNVEFGTYSLTADSDGFLSATCASVDHSTGETTLLEATLLAGDIDNSGVIDITDAVAIGNVFGSTADETADLNTDGVVDILDLILMAANYGQTSDDNPWVCQ